MIAEVTIPELCNVGCNIPTPTIGNTTQEQFGYIEPDTLKFIRYDSGTRVAEVFDNLLCVLEDKLLKMKDDNLIDSEIVSKVLIEAMSPLLTSSVQFSLGMHTAVNNNVQAEIARVSAQAQIDKVVLERNLTSVQVATGIENIRQMQLNGEKDRASKVIVDNLNITQKDLGVENINQLQLNGTKDRASKTVSDNLRIAQTALFNTQKEGIVHKSKVDVLSTLTDIWTITAVEEVDASYQVNNLMTTVNNAVSGMGSGI